MKRSAIHQLGVFILSLVLVGCDGDECPFLSGEKPSSLGVFSETPPNLLPDNEIYIGTFKGEGATFDEFDEDSAERKEGTFSLKSTISARGSGFAGWFISWGDEGFADDNSCTVDMSDYSDGSLVFWVKSPVNLEVGVRSGNVPAGSETSKVLLSRFMSFESDNTWRQVCIPLSEFQGSSRDADLSRIKVLFVVASSRATGGTGGVPQTFWIDDVRWETTNCPPS